MRMWHMEPPSKIPVSDDTQGKGRNPWSIPLGTDASLFSSSLPVLPHEKWMSNKSVDDNAHSFNQFHMEEGETSRPGSFLPGDEDELLAGIMDDFDLGELPTQLEELEDDLFGGGGFEMEPELQDNLFNGFAKLSMSPGSGSTVHYGYPNGSTGTVAGEHPYGEHPSRTLFVRNINSNVEDSELRSLFEQYGDIRTLYTACKHRGFVMISYYDIRAARTAMRSLQNKPLRRRKLDIHFSIPKENPSEKDINQGTLVVFNLDPSVTNEELCQKFGTYGEVKEVRETPHKRHHKFIEFYDVRAAEAALKALNRSDIAGKRIKLEPSRPGGARRNLMQQLSLELDHDDVRTFRNPIGSPIASSPPGSWANFGSPVEPNPLHNYSASPNSRNLSTVTTNHMSGLASIIPSPLSNPMKIAPIGKETGRVSQVSQHSHSFNEKKPSSGSGIGTLSGPEFLWGSPPPTHSERDGSSVWSTSPMGKPYSHWQGPLLGPGHHVGSAPSGAPLERHFGFYPESPETSYLSSNLSNNGSHVMNTAFTGGSFSESGSPDSRMMPLSRNIPIFFGSGSYGGSGSNNGEGMIERVSRARRMETGNTMDNKKQYHLDLEKIMRGEDSRTTLMIKNIPNKYTSKMLLAAIDETHKSSYDFLYLPIDFKNKCNVGYAFINMVSPQSIISFYEIFNGKRWEKFNSEKVASLAYARIQGKAALVAHFQNSSLMNEDKWCRPILIQSEGENPAQKEPLLSSNLNVFIRHLDGSYSGDSLDSPKDNDSSSNNNNNNPKEEMPKTILGKQQTFNS
ncbi:hypothetical protein DM860_014674 [Cuscuta australis]|uniref:RRM domain-containing protein n=1 Tax=Cuscuta australis TaxID=267555 RepID=A0A328DIB2_9ASTE|nr:hypothetical protein DM860_014674 [Cuscuta australis]